MSSFLPARAWALLLLAAPLACTPAATPGRPGTPAQPATPSAAAPERTFAYAPGSYVYELRNVTRIQPVGDSAMRVDSVSTVAVIRYDVHRDSAGALAVAGAVDSFTVQSPAGTGAPQQLLQQPVAFTALLDTSGAVRSFTAPDSADCASPTGALLAAARDILVPVPVHVKPGTRWDDSTSSTVCRGNIPVTTTARQHYEVLPSQTPGTLLVQRSSDITISGSSTHRGTPIAITGTGTATAQLHFDLAHGRFVASSGSYDAHLRFDGAGVQQSFEQVVRQEVKLRE